MPENWPGDAPERFEPLEPARPHNLFADTDGIRPVWRLLLYLALLLTPVSLLTFASHLTNGPGVATRPSSGPLTLWPETATLAEFAQFGFVCFATWIMSRIEDRSLASYGFARPRRYLGLTATGALWGFLFMCLLIGLLWGTHYLVFTGVQLSPTAALGYAVAWIVNFVGVALFEEFLFRGYLQFILTVCLAGLLRWLAPRNPRADTLGFWLAALLISFGFGFVHGGNTGESPVGLLCAGLAGLLFAFSLWRTGVLWWAIGFHAAWDWAQSYLFGVADSGTLVAKHLLGSHPRGPVLLSGGATGPEGSLFVLPVMSLMAVVIALTLRRRTETCAGFALAPADVCTAPAPVNLPRA